MLFDSILIESYILSLLHMEIGVGNKIIDSFYEWITKYVEPLLEEEMKISNMLIDLQVEQVPNKQTFEKWTEQILYSNCRMKNWEKWIDCTKEKDYNNHILIQGLNKDEYLNEIQIIKLKINELMDQRIQKDSLILSIKQCVTYIYIYIQNL